jgi:predicted MFS family arabinose efflux permease
MIRSSRSTALLAVAFAVIMLGTTLPTPLYPAYEQRFGFGQLTVTVVFATYAVGVLIALLAFGRASDTLGRRPMLAAAIAVSALSAVTFLVVGSLPGSGSLDGGGSLYGGGEALLLVGRALSGLSAGMVTGTATAALADAAPPGRQLRASLVAAVANIGGLGLGPLVSGVLAQYASDPLQVVYAVHLGLLVLAAGAVAMVPDTVAATRPRRLRMQRLRVPPEARGVLVKAGTAGFAGFAVLGLFTAVSPAFLALLGRHSPLGTGLVVFSVFAASAGGQLASARLALRTSLLTGIVALVVGIVAVGISLGASSLPLLVGGGIVAGVGQGLSFRSALAAVTGASPAHQRGEVASSFFAICYVGISLPVVGVGAGTKAFGLVPAGEVFAGIIAALSLAALIALARPASSGPPASSVSSEPPASSVD